MNPAEWLARTARNTPEAPALYHGEELIADYAGFERRSAALGAYLRALGVGIGDRVAAFLSARLLRQAPETELNMIETGCRCRPSQPSSDFVAIS